MPDQVQTDQVLPEEKLAGDVIAPSETKDDGLPEDASERTKEQFEKLKAHNAELSEKLKALEDTPTLSPFDQFQAEPPQVQAPVLPQIPGLPAQQVAGIYQGLVDNDGYIDQNVLKRELGIAQEEARKAREESRMVRENVRKMEESQQREKVFAQFPQMDPYGSSFNKKFYEAVTNQLTVSYLKGKPDLLQATKDVAAWFPLETAKPLEATEAQKKAGLQAKQANLSGSTTGRGVSLSPDQADLVKRTQRGDTSALAERLKNAGL